jgi:hypothetical protein
MKPVYLEAISVVAPGLDGWEACSIILRGESEYSYAPIPFYSPELLPRNERRRVSPTIRIAMQAAGEAMEAASLNPEQTAAVFASINGDLDISDRICDALTREGKPVSPIDFHNSVHNAAAGYWAIGNHCNLATTSLSAGNASFAAGLLEAVTQLNTDEDTVLLVAYDLPPPVRLSNRESEEIPFASGLALSRNKSASSTGSLALRLSGKAPGATLLNRSLEQMLIATPSASSLLVAELVARETASYCTLPYLDNTSMLVEYTPC